jgi:branched-chain amino acid transport system permease protein
MGGFLSSRPMGDVFLGLTQGVVYGLVALGLVLIWRATRILNFALGAIATGGAYVGLGLLSYNVGYWWCFVAAIPAGMLIGAITERTLARPLYGKPEINPIVAMVGLLGLIESVVGTIWGTNERGVPAPFSFVNWQVSGDRLQLSPVGLFQIVTALALAIAIWALFRFTNLGLQLRAAAVAPEVSRLLGVRVGRMLTLGWALACGVATIAAVIVSSGGLSSGLLPASMEAPFAAGFIAAAVGGLESPFGAVVGGISLGVLEAFVTDYWNPNLALPVPLAILVVVLLIRPQGLFATAKVRRV